MQGGESTYAGRSECLCRVVIVPVQGGRVLGYLSRAVRVPVQGGQSTCAGRSEYLCRVVRVPVQGGESTQYKVLIVPGQESAAGTLPELGLGWRRQAADDQGIAGWPIAATGCNKDGG